MKQLDNLHFCQTDLDLINSYNRRNMAIISPRELGKSTLPFHLASYRKFKATGLPTLAVARHAADIDYSSFASIQESINEFVDDKVEIKFTAGKSGIGYGFIDGKLFIVYVPLNLPSSRFKKIKRAVWSIQFDEFIIDTEKKEKYLPNEAFTFNELFKTFEREAPNHRLPCYFYGNPYSVYNPYFADWGVDFSKLKPGAFYVNKNCVVDCAVLKPELIESIKARRPDYVFDDVYQRYAFGGHAINDENKLIVPVCPPSFRLVYCFKNNGKTLGVFVSYTDENRLFWVGFLKDDGKRRAVFVYNFRDLVANTSRIDVKDRRYFSTFVRAIGQHLVGYQNVEAAYEAENLYRLLGGSNHAM